MALLQWDATMQMLKVTLAFSILEDVKLLPRCPGPPQLNSVCGPVNY